MSFNQRLNDTNRLYKERIDRGECIYCGSFHVWCKCSWWTLHRFDVIAVGLSLLLGTALVVGLWCMP